MNELDSVPTWDALSALGFQIDHEALVKPSLCYDFGNFKLSACCGMNRWFAEVILLDGILSTPRTVAEVNFQMPLQIKSRQQCAAWIVWHLDNANGSAFYPARTTTWVQEGRQNFGMLPWVAESTAYYARPRCRVPRDWLRVALKTIGQGLATADDEAAVVFSFDGELLTIRCAESVVALPGEGSPWPNRYTLPAEGLRHLPKRIISESVEVSVWEGRLQIGRNWYPGVFAD